MRIVHRLALVLGLIALAIAGVGILVWAFSGGDVEPEVFRRIHGGMTLDEVSRLFGRDAEMIVEAPAYANGVHLHHEVWHVWFIDRGLHTDSIRVRLGDKRTVHEKRFLPGPAESVFERLQRMVGWDD